MAVLVGWFSGSLSLSLFLIPLVNSALATVSSGFRIRLFFVVHTQKKETTHWIMEWNESFVFSVFIHFNKSLNFSQPCQLMKASLFFSLCAYQFFLLLLFFRHFVFFLSPTPLVPCRLRLSWVTRRSCFCFCILSSKSLCWSFGYYGSNWNKLNKCERRELREPTAFKARHISKSVKRQWNAQFVSVSFARWTRCTMGVASCVLLAPLNSATRLNLVAGTIKP